MKAICQPVSGVCSQCNEPVTSRRTCPAGSNAHLVKSRPRPIGCDWQGPATGEIALVRCSGCCGNVRKKYAIHACALFEECLPMHGNVDGTQVLAESGRRYQGCPGCKHYSRGVNSSPEQNK